MKKTLLLLLCGGFAMAQSIGVTTFATGFETVTQINSTNDGRMFATEVTGTIKIINTDGSVNAQPFLQLPASEVLVSGEQGLIGTTFHPNFQQNGYFYISYIRASDGDLVVKRYSVSSGNPDLADASSGTEIIVMVHNGDIHKGGNLNFGPDGFLYIAVGDDGTNGLHSQSVYNLNGKILRIDVNNGFPYSIPAGNPLIGLQGMPEIYLMGFRNPWKFNFDRSNGDLWIADVGQAEVEEVNHLAAGYTPGQNFGWPCYEGATEYAPSSDGCPDASQLTMPVFDYHHVSDAVFNGCSVTGGFVYRGQQYPAFDGIYFFADYCRTAIGTYSTTTDTWSIEDVSGMGEFPTTFGQDNNGELYVAANGTIYKIIDTEMSVSDFGATRPTLYPNPAKNEIRVHGLDSGFQLEVTDAAGRNLAQRKFQDPSANLLENLSLKPGLYVFQIISDGGTKNTYKVVIE